MTLREMYELALYFERLSQRPSSRIMNAPEVDGKATFVFRRPCPWMPISKYTGPIPGELGSVEFPPPRH